MVRRTLACGFFLSLTCLAPHRVAAQEAGPTEATVARDAEARGLFEAGRAAFADGRFEDARDYFRRSYELSRRDALLYNIGTAEDRLRNDAAALAAFEGYLAALPDAENAAEVRARIAHLREALAQRGRGESEPSPLTSPSSARVPVVTIVLTGLALAAAGASIGTWVAANDAYGERERGCFAMGGCSDAELTGIASLIDATNGLWISSLALAVGAAIVLPLELGAASTSEGARARLELRPTGVRIGVIF